jgi:hypothetical protein
MIFLLIHVVEQVEGFQQEMAGAAGRVQEGQLGDGFRSRTEFIPFVLIG